MNNYFYVVTMDLGSSGQDTISKNLKSALSLAKECRDVMRRDNIHGEVIIYKYHNKDKKIFLEDDTLFFDSFFDPEKDEKYKVYKI